ncbi:hypothetical protein ACVMH6_000257 [Rhizobium leguminosarum]
MAGNRSERRAGAPRGPRRFHARRTRPHRNSAGRLMPPPSWSTGMMPFFSTPPWPARAIPPPSCDVRELRNCSYCLTPLIPPGAVTSPMPVPLVSRATGGQHVDMAASGVDDCNQTMQGQPLPPSIGPSSSVRSARLNPAFKLSLTVCSTCASRASQQCFMYPLHNSGFLRGIDKEIVDYAPLKIARIGMSCAASSRFLPRSSFATLILPFISTAISSRI